MRIGLAYDLQTDPTDERQAEFDPPTTIQGLHRALESLGHTVCSLGSAHQILTSPERLRDVELIFNITEGTHGRCREAWLPTLLEWYGIPYVGSDPLALSLGLDKVMCKRLAQSAGIPTPPWISLDHPQALPQTIPLRFPVIVKPRCEGSGRGIDAGAVVNSSEAVAARVHWLFQRCDGPVMIEEYLPGGELTVLIIGNDPPMALPAIQRPLDPATRLAYHVIKPSPSTWVCPVMLDHTLERSARAIATRMFKEVTCQDVARVDLRVDQAGQPSFLEINPLPSYDPEGTLGLLAEYLGTTYSNLIDQILNSCLHRLNSAPRNDCAWRTTNDLTELMGVAR